MGKPVYMRVTPEDIELFHTLYAKYGTYAQVARDTGFSASTVSRYVKLSGTPAAAKHTWREILPT